MVYLERNIVKGERTLTSRSTPTSAVIVVLALAHADNSCDEMRQIKKQCAKEET